ncbi:MAG: protein GlmU [Desulfobacteraceae bacterium]|nr:protein GlmU [Desulfobacteraceae bacterium]
MITKTAIERLIDKGVRIPNPSSVFIGEDVDPDRISGQGVILHPGTRILGEKTLIMAGSTIGYEAPVTLDNTMVGPDTSLKGGFFQDAVFAGRNVFGSGAHVRGGTILEEQASAAHTVGLKQTILFPFVTLGSLINFCDILMAGGTSRKDHSEVGSSYIHFNYTPNQDKATPSMLGNVHQGVMLNQRPVFLGGQGGLVGPCRLAFGTVTAAGTICRRDELRPDRIVFGGALKDGSIPRKEGVYTNAKKIYEVNCEYIAGLISLMNWYRHVRSRFVSDPLSDKLHQGMTDTLQVCIDERIKRLGAFCGKLEGSRKILISRAKGEVTESIRIHDAIIKKWPDVQAVLISETGHDYSAGLPEPFLDAVNGDTGYIETIKGLDGATAALGSDWLRTIEQTIMEKVKL